MPTRHRQLASLSGATRRLNPIIAGLARIGSLRPLVSSIVLRACSLRSLAGAPRPPVSKNISALRADLLAPLAYIVSN